MNAQTPATTSESAFPMELAILPAVIGALVWISAVLPRFAH